MSDSVVDKKRLGVRDMTKVRFAAVICCLLGMAIAGQAQQKSESRSYALKAARMFDG